MTFEEWFEQEFVPSFAYSGEDPHPYESVARSAWEAAYQSGYTVGYDEGYLQGYDTGTESDGMDWD